MKIILARRLAKMAAPVSINLFKFVHFTLENSIQKRDRTSNEKNVNMRRWRLLLLRVKIPFVYCQLNIEDLSVTGYFHAFVTECVYGFSKSGEEKINYFIVVVSSLNFLIDEQISNMKVFKGTQNVAIVEEFEVPPQILFYILRHSTRLINKFSATSWKKKKR